MTDVLRAEMEMTFSLAVLAMKFVMVVKRRRLASVAVVSFLLLTSMDANVAVRAEPAVPDGTAAMLRVRIPFGGRATAVSQTSLTMNFGYHWRLSPGAVRKLEHHFTPALQAGWMLSGRPVFRVGAIDALRVFSDRANAQADDVSGGGNARFLWIGLGVIVVGATVAVLATDDEPDRDCHPIAPPPPLPPPPGTPSLPCVVP